jgi:hypothetical protein
VIRDKYIQKLQLENLKEKYHLIGLCEVVKIILKRTVIKEDVKVGLVQCRAQ